MKALAIDTAITKISVAAENEGKRVSATFDIGMKQSETLLPAVGYVLEKAGLNPSELENLSITKGPGSFTGLRLGYACIKAFQIGKNLPLYAFSSLDVYAKPFENIPLPLISAIDAHKDKFYLKAFGKNTCGKENCSCGDGKLASTGENSSSQEGKLSSTGDKLSSQNETHPENALLRELVIPEGDYEKDWFCEKLKEAFGNEKILLCGPDTASLKEVLLDHGFSEENLIALPFTHNPCDALLSLSEEAFKKGKAGINEYDGPNYLRESEAETNLTKN